MPKDRILWPILLLLLTALIPSLGVIWMMREAVSNDQLAATQRMKNACSLQLTSASELVQKRWKENLSTLEAAVDSNNPTPSFERAIELGLCESLIVLNENREPVYPSSDAGSTLSSSYPSAEAEPWNVADKLEFRDQQFAAAAEQWSSILNDLTKKSRAGDETTDNSLRQCQARQAIARCLIKAGRIDEAVFHLHELWQRNVGETIDARGRSLALNAGYRILEITSPESRQWKQIAQELIRRITNYDDQTDAGGKRRPISSAQRLFLMNRLASMPGVDPTFKTLHAESLANQFLDKFDSSSFLESEMPAGTLFNGEGLFEGEEEIFYQPTSDDSAVAIWTQEDLKQRIESYVAKIPLPDEVHWVVNSKSAFERPWIDVALSPLTDQLRIGIDTKSDLFSEATGPRTGIYIMISLLVVAATTMMAWLLGKTVRNRLNLAQQKNNLVANVSHELKTPLSSVRLLVDTMLREDDSASDARSQKKRHEYLQLISQENARLSRLIDNFLTFSRLDQRGQRFDSSPLKVETVVRDAIRVFAERAPESANVIELSVLDDVQIVGDLDSLVTVLVNLIENAWKYNENDDLPAIKITVKRTQGQTEISVADNGIGMTAREAANVFDRFYQASSLMTRPQGGCGLGLSIVKTIVDAHRGRVSVTSQPGQGSTFTVLIPCLNAAEDSPEKGSNS